MKHPLGIQLFTVRDNLKTYGEAWDTLKKLRDMGYTKLQTAGCEFGYDKLAELTRELGFEVVGTHYGLDDVRDNFDRVVNENRLLGSTNIGLGGIVFESLAQVESFINCADEIAAKCAKVGMKFTYHNHAHEFGRWENGLTTMDMLARRLDPENTSFVLDTYWVQYGGADVCGMIEALAGRIDILHLKDMAITDFTGWHSRPVITSVGAGNLDWKRILRSAERAGVKHYIVEQDTNWSSDCLEAAKSSAEYLKGTGEF